MIQELDIDELRAKYSKLKKRVAKLQRSPAGCDVELAQLKKQKLTLKDRLVESNSDSVKPTAEIVEFQDGDSMALADRALKPERCAVVGT